MRLFVKFLFKVEPVEYHLLNQLFYDCYIKHYKT